MTEPLNVTIVILGYADSLFDIDLLKKHQSSFFKIDNIWITIIIKMLAFIHSICVLGYT